MTDTPPERPSPRRRPPRTQNSPLLPPELLEIITPTLKVGAGAGALGLFVGATAGIARSSTPILFALASGAQWFVLGSTYYGTRDVVMRAWGGETQLSPSRKVQASAVGGGVAGTIGGLLRSRSNVLPGLVVCSLLGAGGQMFANSWASRPAGSQKSWLDSKWSPVTVLSDSQYEKMLEEKVLGFEADIALIDDRIQALRAAKGESKPLDLSANGPDKKI